MLLIHTWIAILGFAVFLYVILDGFGLGIGLLFPFMRSEEERSQLMESIAPVWDANQTWLVFGGGGFFVAFPIVYGVLFSALYIPLFTLLYGLIFRGVSFEFRANAVRKRTWDRAFFLGSLFAVLAQGFTLGGVLSGVRMSGGYFAGRPFDWLTPFSLATALGLVSGYVLLASTYLNIKMTGRIQSSVRRIGFWCAIVVLILQAVVVAWTPRHFPGVVTHWVSAPRVYFIWIFPVLSLASFYGILRSLRSRREVLPFLFSVVFFFCGYLGLFASIYPYAVPPYITFREAAAETETLVFTLWGAAIIMPVVLGYTVYSYSVFRGKVTGEHYYH